MTEYSVAFYCYDPMDGCEKIFDPKHYLIEIHLTKDRDEELRIYTEGPEFERAKANFRIERGIEEKVNEEELKADENGRLSRRLSSAVLHMIPIKSVLIDELDVDARRYHIAEQIRREVYDQLEPDNANYDRFNIVSELQGGRVDDKDWEDEGDDFGEEEDDEEWEEDDEDEDWGGDDFGDDDFRDNGGGASVTPQGGYKPVNRIEGFYERHWGR